MRGPPFTDGKVNLWYTGDRVKYRCDGYDTIIAQVLNTDAGDMVAATLTHAVSADGVTWHYDLFPGTTITTAAGTQKYTGDPVNVQGWPWYALEVTTPASGTKLVRVAIYGKVNT